MHTRRAHSRFMRFASAAITGVAAVSILIYVIVARPDYRTINNVAHITLPIIKYAGDIISWPVRIAGRAAIKIREISTLRAENEELRAKLSDAILRENEFKVAVTEVQRLQGILNLQNQTPKNTIAAEIEFDMAAFAHETFFINKGENSNVKPGMAVVDMQGQLIGQIIDVGADFARARALTDAKSNTPVRISGTNVYGFLVGNGGKDASITLLSDPNFEITENLPVVTSGIKGVMPDGLIVGMTDAYGNVFVANAVRDAAVLVLEFDGPEMYK